MAAFATPSELAGFLQQDLDTYSANQALDIATSKIRDFVGWSITQELGVTVTLDGCSGESILWLPSLLVTAVSSVVENGIALTSSQYDWTTYGALIRRGGTSWYWKPRSIVAVFDHGYTTTPDTVKGVCLAAAGRQYGNPAGIKSETVGAVSVTYNTPLYVSGAFLTENEKADLAAYRRAVVA